MYRIWLLLLLGGYVVPGVRRVSGIDIYTPSEMEAVNGTDVRLKCTFKSTHPVSLQSVSVSWNFRPLNSGSDESLFYYQDAVYPPERGRFKGRAVWSGDILRGDASITLQQVQPTFNGTYVCQVRNRPDVHGSNGEIILKVVNKASFSEISILAAAVGGACGVILILLCIVLAVRFYRNKHMENDIEMHTREQEWRDPTVWWGLGSRSSSAPLLLGTGVELIGYLGPLCWRTQRNVEGEKASLSSMFAPPVWAFQILLLSIYFSIRPIMYRPFHSPRILHLYMFYQKLPVIKITNLTHF